MFRPFAPICSTDVLDLHIEKRRTEAELTLATGASVHGCFFLASSSATHAPERVGDLLNAEGGFFLFELSGGRAAETVLYNRSHIVLVTLLDANAAEAQLEPGYAVATERGVRMLLSNGRTIEGCVRVYQPTGRDRLSDYARAPQVFHYVETPVATYIVNTAHIVELRETSEA
jgi:hypothetical protein